MVAGVKPADAIICLALFGSVAFASIQATAKDLSHTAIAGRASVIDADTIEISGQRIRFNGIDAPESRQSCDDAQGHPYRCGTMAANALSEWLAQSSPTTCDVTGKDRYQRAIATCSRADGADVNSWLVRSGYALDWPRYSKGAYADDQARAQAEKAGIWQGSFQEPWEWRKAKRKN